MDIKASAFGLDITGSRTSGDMVWLRAFCHTCDQLEAVEALARQRFGADPQHPQWRDLAALALISTHLGDVLAQFNIIVPPVGELDPAA